MSEKRMHFMKKCILFDKIKKVEKIRGKYLHKLNFMI